MNKYINYVDLVNNGGKMFCQKCGTELKEDSKFCSSCGFSLENAIIREKKKGIIGEFLEDIKLSFTLSGRFSRREYATIWLGIICSLILFYFVLGMLMGGLGIKDLESEPSIKVIDSVWSVGIIIIFFGASIRRFHDIDKSGWYVLLLFIPLISLYFFLCLFFEKGKEIGKTRWG